MKYDVNSIEYVKNQKTKYVIQMSEHVFQICIDYFVHKHIFKSYFFICSNILCEMFYLLHCFASAELKCFCVLSTLMCLFVKYFIIQ